MPEYECQACGQRFATESPSECLSCGSKDIVKVEPPAWLTRPESQHRGA